MTNKLAIFDLMDLIFCDEIVNSFNNLSLDQISYNAAKSPERYRCLSSFRWHDGEITLESKLSPHFTKDKTFHSKCYNENPIDELPLDLTRDSQLYSILNILISHIPKAKHTQILIGVDQLRCFADSDFRSDNAPDKLHQDGFDYKCDLVVRRNNVSCGETLVSLSADDCDIFMKKELEANEFMLLNDKTLYHGATSLLPIQDGTSHLDFFVINFIIS